MTWLEVTIDTPETEALSIELDLLGIGGIIIEDFRDFQDFLDNNPTRWDFVDEELAETYKSLSRVKFYLTDDSESTKTLKLIRERLGVTPTVSRVDDSDWENNWREHYQPIEVGENFLIVPEWLSPDENGTDGTRTKDARFILKLDPGLAFGTGSHPSTQLCLAALERHCGIGKRVLDIGSGSGILGIGALLLGCYPVFGCDIDEKSLDAAMSNAALNGFYEDSYKIFAGDVIQDADLRARLGHGYDVVLANIVADVIINLAPYVLDFLSPGGVFICSGIIEGRQDEVAETLTGMGLATLYSTTTDDWYCMAYSARM